MLTETPNNEPQSERALKVLTVGLGLAGVFTILYAAQTSTIAQFFGVLGVALVLAASALLIGGLLGFLFAIPRTLPAEAGSQAPQVSAIGETPAPSAADVNYGVNTNLEQISDWLTKILVGVGLTQIATFPELMKGYVGFISPGLGGFPSSGAFAIALLLVSLVDGFLIAYLWTRTYFAAALRHANAVSRLAAVEKKLDSIDLDARAWSLTQQLLNAQPGTPPPPQKDINAIIAAASGPMKAQIFWAAKNVRAANWRPDDDKVKMEATIPIFRALIAADTEHHYHANHGQLGFALKDKRDPNYAEAKAELTEAIRLRGDWQTSGWAPYYELVRAQCLIHLDGSFRGSQRSEAPLQAAILADLETACGDEQVALIVLNDADIASWMRLNQVAPTRLRVAAGTAAGPNGQKLQRVP